MRPGMGHSLMPSFSTISRCNETKPISNPGMTKTCSAKNRDSVAPAMMGPPSSRCTSVRADQGNAAGDGSADAEAPVGVLVEAQHLPGEGHAQRHQQQEDADDPGQLAGKLVGAEQKHLAHVDEHDGDHEVGAPAVYRAQEPSQRDVVIQILQAVPGFGGGGHIDQRQHDAGDHLQDEDGQRGAAEDVPPARRLARHRMRHRIADRAADLQPPLEPVADAASALTSASPGGQAGGGGQAWAAGRPRSAACRFRLCSGYSNSPRSGGPEAREPSW